MLFVDGQPQRGSVDVRTDVSERCARAAAQLQNVDRSQDVGFIEIAGSEPAFGNRCPRRKMKNVVDSGIVKHAMCDVAVRRVESDDTVSIPLERLRKMRAYETIRASD